MAPLVDLAALQCHITHHIRAFTFLYTSEQNKISAAVDHPRWNAYKLKIIFFAPLPRSYPPTKTQVCEIYNLFTLSIHSFYTFAKCYTFVWSVYTYLSYPRVTMNMRTSSAYRTAAACMFQKPILFLNHLANLFFPPSVATSFDIIFRFCTYACRYTYIVGTRVLRNR